MSGVGGFRLGFLTLLVVAPFASPTIEGNTARGAESPKPRCALVIATPSPTATLLEAALLETGSAEWLERDQIDRILAEQELGAAFAVGAVKSRVALGRLLKADLLVLVQIRPAEPATGPDAERPAGRIDLVVAETAGGMRILAQAVPQTDDPAADARKALTPIAGALRKYAETIREVYAVPPFLSRDLGHRNDHLMSAYAKLVEQVLLAQPGVLVVEIEEAETIAREIALAGPGDRLVRPMPLYLMGEFRHEGLGDAQKVTIALQAKRGNAILGRASKTMSPSEAPAYLQRVAGGLLARGKVSTARFDPQAEASHLAQRSADFLTLRDWHQALALAEASLLLDPDQIEPRAGAILAISRIVQGRDPQTRRRPAFSESPLSEQDVGKMVTIHADILQLRRRAFEHLKHALTVEDSDRVSDMTIQTALGSRRCGRYPSHVPEPLASALWQQIEMERDFALERAYHYADRGQWDRSQVFLELARDRMMPARAADESLKFLAKYHREPGCLGPFGLALSDATPTSVEVQGMCRQVLAWDDLNRQVELRIRHAQKVAEANKDYFARSHAASQAAKAAPFETARVSPKLGFHQINISCEAHAEPIDDLATCLAFDDGSDVFLGENGNIYHVAEPGRATLIWKPLRFGSKGYDPRRSVASDGRYLWIVYDTEAALGQRLFVVDPTDGRNWEIERKHGLPAVTDFVKGAQGPKPSPMLVAPIRPGEAIVAGSHGDTWIAHIRFDPEGNHRVHVFHEAHLAHSHEVNGPGDADHDDSWKNPHVAIAPSHISVWEIPESEKLVMIGRHLSDLHCPIFAEHPLLVNPADLSVKVMQHEWQNRGTHIGVSTLSPRGQYFFDAVDDEIHLMYQEHPERDPVSLFSGIQEGCLVVDGDSVHVAGRVWQRGSLSTGQWHSLGETPWHPLGVSRLSNGRALPKRPFSLYGIGRSNLYGFVANYGSTIDHRVRRNLVQVVFDGTGLPFSKLPSLEDAPPPHASLSVKPRETTSLPKPGSLWQQNTEDAIESGLLRVSDLAYSPDGKWIVTTQRFDKDCVRLWDGKGRIIASLLDHPRGMNRVAFSPSGQYFATMSHDGSVLVWATATRQLCRRFQGNRGSWCQVAISPNDRYVVGVPYPGDGFVWDLRSGEKLCTLSCLREPNCWMRFSPDSTQLLADAGKVNPGFGLRFWDLSSGRIASRAATPCRVAGFLPDGAILALSENHEGSDALIAWDYRNNTYRKLWDHAYGWPVAVSADGRRVAIVHSAGTGVWDLATQQKLATHPKHMSGRWAFSPDGKWLVSGNGSLVRLAVPE